MAIELVCIATQHRTPIYIYNLPKLTERIDEIKSSLDGIPYKLFFFESANRCSGILELIGKSQLGLTVVRPRGIFRALDFGFEPQQIECSGFGFSSSDFSVAVENGVFLNIGSAPEIDLFRRKYPRKNFGARVSLQNDFKEKRGIEPDELISMARQSDFFLTSIHAYDHTNERDVNAQIESARKIFSFSSKLPETSRHRLLSINLGGGHGHNYNDGRSFDWMEYGKKLKILYQEYESCFRNKLTIKFELGRSLVVDCGYFVSRIIHAFKKDGQMFVSLDSNVSHFPRPLRYGFSLEQHPFMDQGIHKAVLLDSKGNIKEPQSSSANKVAIVGNSHYSKDWFGYIYIDKFSPEELVNSFIVFLDSGAYCEVMTDSWTDDGPANSVVFDRDGINFEVRNNVQNETTIKRRGS
ncbi:MAG: hypothetical protein VYA55_22195 [Pseudomonadota bacterium]|nr:hypothetical protein [Pseudomonadota bacterium]